LNLLRKASLTLKHSPDVESANSAVAGFGGKLLDWNLTLGPYDIVAKVDFPDDKAFAAFSLALAATGN
jgi:uncharacterized protein with GYD domain